MAPSKTGSLRLILATLVCASLISCSRQNQATDPIPFVPVSEAIRTNLSDELVLTAEFIPYQEVDVMAKVAGYVRTIRIDMGDHVREGELLATLEDPELQDEMDKAAAAVKAAQSDVITAQNDVLSAKAAHEIAHLSYTRIQDVSHKDPGLIPQQDVDVARSHDLEAEAQLSTAQSTLQSKENRSAEALDEQKRLQTMYEYTSITAPFTGVITKRYANTGSMIQAGISSQTQSMPIVRLAQDDLLRLILPVPVSVVPQIHIGQTVDVNVTTLDKTWPGKVTRFANTIQPSTRTMDTEVDVPNPKLAIVPGMYAEVHLHLQDRQGALSLPLDAVEGLGSESERVYEVGPDHIVRVIPVKTGIETASQVEILSGVHAGDICVVGRHTGITDGERVQPQVAAYDAVNGNPQQEN